MKEESGRFCSVRSRGRAMVLLICWVITCSLIAVGSTAVRASDEVVAKEWRIPMLTVLTGPVAFAGVPAKWAAEYAINEINAAGGIRGVPVKLTAYDTAMDNAKAVQAMARAIPGSLVVLGPLDGRGSTAVAQELVENKILSLNSNTNAAMLSSSKPYSVAYMQDPSKGSVVGVKKWLQLEPWIKSVSMFYDPSDPASKDALDKFQAGIAGTGVKVVPIEISAGQLDFGQDHRPDRSLAGRVPAPRQAARRDRPPRGSLHRPAATALHRGATGGPAPPAVPEARSGLPTWR